MAFPASNGTAAPMTVEVGWATARQAASQIQAQANVLNSQISGGAVSAQVLIGATTFFATLNAQLTTCAAVPGIATYAQAQINNSTLDIAAAFNAMQTALTNVTNWVVSNFPKDSGGFIQASAFTAAGQVTWASFTTAQLAGLQTLLTALSATIN